MLFMLFCQMDHKTAFRDYVLRGLMRILCAVRARIAMNMVLGKNFMLGFSGDTNNIEPFRVE